jgi:hypothetical protein
MPRGASVPAGTMTAAIRPDCAAARPPAPEAQRHLGCGSHQGRNSGSRACPSFDIELREGFFVGETRAMNVHARQVSAPCRRKGCVKHLADCGMRYLPATIKHYNLLSDA